MLKSLSTTLFLLFLLQNSTLFSQHQILKPSRNDVAPVLDASLDEGIWENSMVADELTAYWPVFGKPYPFKTEIYMSYTDEDMYFGFKCFDDEPDKIKSTMSARDQIRNEDWVAVILDPFNDQQSVFAFYVNAQGVQMDSKGLPGGSEDESADFVYYSSGRVTEDGYIVEMRIPFKSLRYKRGDIVEMGIMFERRIQRLTISGTSPAMDPQKGLNFFTQMRPLHLQNIKYYTLVELIPAVTYSRQKAHSDGSLGLIKSQPDFSLTGKVGITSQLVLDLTYNPDFSQVEADAGQIDENQRYKLFYPEKRPFFQEGKESFDIAAVNEHGDFKNAIHTRQISNPLLGAKLSGKISPKTRIALLYSLDEKEQYADSSSRFTNFMAARLKQALNDDSYLGLIATSRVDPYGKQNSVIGTDGRLRLGNAAAIEYHLLASSSLDNEDSNADSGIGTTIAYVQNNNDRDFRIEAQRIGTKFQSQTGYLRRNGFNRSSLSYTPHFDISNSFFTRISPMSFVVARQDIISTLWEFELGLGTRLVGEKSLNLTTFINPSNEVFLSESFKTNSFHLMGSIQINPRWLVETSYRFGNLVRYTDNPFGGYGNTISLTVGYQPASKFNSTLDINYADFYRLSDNGKEFNYLILRSKNTYQLNKYLFIRAIAEYNSFRKDLNTDFLISFTYIPGTVIHLGYGSLYERQSWTGYEYQPGSELMEMKRGIFFKASYLFRR